MYYKTYDHTGKPRYIQSELFSPQPPAYKQRKSDRRIHNIPVTRNRRVKDRRHMNLSALGQMIRKTLQHSAMSQIKRDLISGAGAFVLGVFALGVSAGAIMLVDMIVNYTVR